MHCMCYYSIILRVANCIYVYLPCRILMWHALVYVCSLLCRLRRWCKDRATAYVSAARVTSHGQQEQ
uniref:Uncharacterized protein n=1 Tax=Aegilops tauschii subsp. strangulata TaxID=200361 RepID=A0A453B5K0_AEGTS